MRRLRGECRRCRIKSDWMMVKGMTLSPDGEEPRQGHTKRPESWRNRSLMSTKYMVALTPLGPARQISNFGYHLEETQAPVSFY